MFDGLDEVTSPETGVRVLEEIDEFIQRADREDWDLFTIITTRPTGYTERFMPSDFQQIDLTFLAHHNRRCSWGLKPPVSSSDRAM